MLDSAMPPYLGEHAVVIAELKSINNGTQRLASKRAFTGRLTGIT